MYRVVLLSLFFISTIYSQSVIINEVMASNSSGIQDQYDEYSDWVEVFNPTNNSVNLLDFGLSDDLSDTRKWLFPNVSIAPQSYLIIFASGRGTSNPIGELHTNFKISADGEELILTNSNGQIIDQLEPTAIPANISLGRSIVDPSIWVFFTNSTPGSQNGSDGYSAFSENPIFSLSGGLYPSSINIELSTETTGLDIYYTTDGSDPTKNSTKYLNPISIASTW